MMITTVIIYTPWPYGQNKEKASRNNTAVSLMGHPLPHPASK
jgi:hypothetical protein